MDRKKVRDIIFEAIDEYNAVFSEKQPLIKSEETILYGQTTNFDSLSLVNFIVGIEQKIQATLNVPITLADERAMSQKSSPFRTVGTILDYCVKLLNEGTDE